VPVPLLLALLQMVVMMTSRKGRVLVLVPPPLVPAPSSLTAPVHPPSLSPSFPPFLALPPSFPPFKSHTKFFQILHLYAPCCWCGLYLAQHHQVGGLSQVLIAPR
jgi:hypothetical protein